MLGQIFDIRSGTVTIEAFLGQTLRTAFCADAKNGCRMSAVNQHLPVLFPGLL